ncbi:MAG: hypothetical protein PUP46_03685 [Endozoicomonas sp. (ex Botrylloides leachii)]|nr:hypothetical protein [Endozoicomonas sp. (ex Botrylloides leachii)]
MIIHDKLWKKLPEVLCFVVHDEDGFCGFCFRPIFDKKTNKWLSERSKQLDYLNINGVALPIPFQRLSRLPSHAAILQRPSSWDGVLREGDVIRLSKTNKIYVINGFFNDEKVWLEDVVTKNMTMTSCARISAVNGITVDSHIFKHKQNVSRPELPAEVHNHVAIDGDKALEILKSMCSGGVMPV